MLFIARLYKNYRKFYNLYLHLLSSIRTSHKFIKYIQTKNIILK